MVLRGPLGDGSSRLAVASRMGAGEPGLDRQGSVSPIAFLQTLHPVRSGIHNLERTKLENLKGPVALVSIVG